MKCNTKWEQNTLSTGMIMKCNTKGGTEHTLDWYDYEV